jgi:hypothetical protein
VLRNAGGAEGNNYEPLALLSPGRLPDLDRQSSSLGGIACMRPPDQSPPSPPAVGPPAYPRNPRLASRRSGDARERARAHQPSWLSGHGQGPAASKASLVTRARHGHDDLSGSRRRINDDAGTRSVTRTPTTNACDAAANVPWRETRPSGVRRRPEARGQSLAAEDRMKRQPVRTPLRATLCQSRPVIDHPDTLPPVGVSPFATVTANRPSGERRTPRRASNPREH